MKKFTSLSSIAIPLDRANIDTDAIIPKQFLKSIKRSGFGPNLFDEWRYLDHGEVGMDNSKRPINPDFVLNNPVFKGAKILLTRRNFGCGSSREHAPWALEDFGFRAIIAPSFADIFYNNCFKNGILPIVLSHDIVDSLFSYSGEIVIDLQDQTVTTWLNGKKMISYTDKKIGETNGRIALQIHDGGGIKVKWRNIKLHKLDSQK